MPNIYIHYRHYISNMLHESTPGWLADGQHKSLTKGCLEFKKNVVGHTTFEGQLTMLYRDIVHASFMLELLYFAPILRPYLLLIISTKFSNKLKIFEITDHMHKI